MAVAAKVAAHVARQRTHIGALAALDLEDGAIGVGLDQVEPAYLDLTRRNVDGLAFASEVVGALAGDLDGRKLRRGLHDDAGIFWHQRSDVGLAWARIGCSGDRTLQVVRGSLLAPSDSEPIDLRPVLHVGHGLGRFAERDRQQA